MNNIPIEKRTNSHACIVLVTFIILNPFFHDFGVRWSLVFLFFALMALTDTMISIQKPISITGTKIRFFLFTAAIVFFYLFFNSRKDNETLGYMAIMMVCSMLVVIAETDFSQLKALLIVMCTIGVMLSLYILLAYFDYSLYSDLILKKLPEDIIEYNEWLRDEGYGISIGGSIVFADYVLAISGIALFSILLHYSSNHAKINIYRIIIILILGLFMIAMYIEGRRGEILCFIAALGFIFLLSFYKAGSKMKLKKIAMVAVLIVLLVTLMVFVLNTSNSSRIISTFTQLAGSSENSFGGDLTTGRMNRWMVALDLFQKKPVLGVGWGRYANYYMGDHDSSLVSVMINFKYAHNDYLNVLCETGIVGFVLIYLPLTVNFVLALRQHISLQKKKTISSYRKLLILNTFCIGSQVFWATLGMMDPALYKQLFLCYFAFSTICLNTSMKVEKGFDNESIQTA